MSPVEPAPLVLEPILKEKVWGGRRLTSFGKRLPDAAMIGESWELADLASTSASGGGGDAAHSRIISGPCAGQTLREAIAELGDDLLGGAPLTESGGFPLLVKFLDAREHLSVQVHPSPAYAEAHPDAHLKTECWFVLDAEPGAVIYAGLRPGVGASELREAIESGRVPEVMLSVPAVPGQLHDLPSGTVHALGAGVLVCEVQTPSDTTFRVYDWASEYGRAGRELHIEQALACAQTSPPPAPTAAPETSGLHALVANEHYRVSLARGLVRIPGAGPAVIVATGGPVSAGALKLAHGQTALAPSAIAEGFELDAPDGAIVATLPV